MKKILLILFLSISTNLLAQKSDQETPAKQNRSIENVRAYPNPLISETKISFRSSLNTITILKIKNLLGKTVYAKEFMAKKGNNSILFSKNNLDSGMYIYAIQNKSEIISKRLVIK